MKDYYYYLIGFSLIVVILYFSLEMQEVKNNDTIKKNIRNLKSSVGTTDRSTVNVNSRGSNGNYRRGDQNRYL